MGVYFLATVLPSMIALRISEGLLNLKVLSNFKTK